MLVPHKAAIDVPTRPNKHSVCAVIAANRQTADGLHSYFSSAGITTRTSSRLDDVGPLCVNAKVLVLFPDDFAEDEVRARIVALRAGQPRLLLLLVTATPQRVGSVCEPDARSLTPVVIPKPVFGWNLLDAMRSQFDLS